MKRITQEHLDFLKQLSENNNRSWFKEHKPWFDKVYAEVKVFFGAVYHEMSKTDSFEKFQVHRVYSDLRFSKDKTPYRTHYRLYLKRTKPLLRGGYYLYIRPGKSVISGGFRDPNSKDLLRIRKELAVDSSAFMKSVSGSKFRKYFGQLQGEELKAVPRGFDKDNPAIDLLRKKQFIARRYFTDAEVTSENFFREVVDSFRALRPFFDYMSEVLTTDENGESLFT